MDLISKHGRQINYPQNYTTEAAPLVSCNSWEIWASGGGESRPEFTLGQHDTNRQSKVKGLQINSYNKPFIRVTMRLLLLTAFWKYQLPGYCSHTPTLTLTQDKKDNDGFLIYILVPSLWLKAQRSQGVSMAVRHIAFGLWKIGNGSPYYLLNKDLLNPLARRLHAL